MPLRILGWITMLALAGGCSLIFKEAPSDGGTDPDPSCSPACNSDQAPDCVDGTCQCGTGQATGLVCQPGQVCSGGGQCVCTAESCEAGCCGDDALCRTRTFTSCGLDGESCDSCDVARADSCSGTGGVCECGGNPACAVGQRCVEPGTCICDSESCPDGCCNSEGDCITGDTDTECGTAGADCFDCAAASAGSCVDGACDGCAATCNSAVGENAGCCIGITCFPAASTSDPTTCGGIAGGVCGTCGIGSDNCNGAGECACGLDVPCGVGEECLGGTCLCTQASCPDGCCDPGLGCTTGDTQEACGVLGFICEACVDGQRCDQDGECVCDALSCDDGCCDPDGLCIKPSGADEKCGNGGEACFLCTEVGEGLFCNDTGACVCNAASCQRQGLCCNVDQTMCEPRADGSEDCPLPPPPPA